MKEQNLNENEWEDIFVEGVHLKGETEPEEDSSDSLHPLLEELQAVADRLTAVMERQLPKKLPENYQDLADLYVDVNEAHNLVKHSYETIRHNRELLKGTIVGAMEMRSVKTINALDGTGVTNSPTIYASVKDRGAFVAWARENGREDLLDTKERKGSAKVPGLDAYVRAAVNQHRINGGDLVLPPGVEYSEPSKLIISRKSEGAKFDDGAAGIISRIKEAAEAKDF